MISTNNMAEAVQRVKMVVIKRGKKKRAMKKIHTQVNIGLQNTLWLELREAELLVR